MGYRNLRTSNLREQRRQQSRLSTQAPVGGSSVGHGSGLRFYDGGELIIDGLNTGLQFRVVDQGGGRSVGRMEFTYEDMTDIVAAPLVWSPSDSRILGLHGPLMTDSTGDPENRGLGGTHLQLAGRDLRLQAGPGGDTTASLRMYDTGSAYLSTPNARLYIDENGANGLINGDNQGYWINSEGGAYLVGRQARLNLGSNGHAGIYGPDGSMYINVDGSHGLSDGNGRGYWVSDSGSAAVIGIRSSLRLNSNNSLSLMNQHDRGIRVDNSGNVYLTSSGAEFNIHDDGAFHIGTYSGRPTIQGSAGGALGMWASTVTVNGGLSVTGSKNFIMDHPNKPGHTIKYASTESPVSGIEHRGRVTIGDDGTAEVVFPEHFTAIIKDNTDVDVFLQPYGPDPAWCDVPTREGTTVHGEPGTTVAWHVHAERTGADFTVVEKGTAFTQPEPQPQEAE